MRTLTIAAGILVTTASAQAASSQGQPVLVTAPVEKVFVPLGFDDNDDAEIILHGKFQDTCYKVGPAKATVDVEARKITVEAKAYKYQGVGCAMVLVPFLQSVKIGPVPAGDYEVTVVDRPDTETNKLSIVPARTRNPDDFLYAPVDAVRVAKDATGRKKLVIEGQYPYMFVGCMKIVDVQQQVTPGKVIVVQPVAEIFNDGDAACVEQADGKKFKVERPLTDANEPGEYLAHVRVLAGQSVNKLVDLSE